MLGSISKQVERNFENVENSFQVHGHRSAHMLAILRATKILNKFADSISKIVSLVSCSKSFSSERKNIQINLQNEVQSL